MSSLPALTTLVKGTYTNKPIPALQALQSTIATRVTAMHTYAKGSVYQGDAPPLTFKYNIGISEATTYNGRNVAYREKYQSEVPIVFLENCVHPLINDQAGFVTCWQSIKALMSRDQCPAYSVPFTMDPDVLLHTRLGEAFSEGICLVNNGPGYSSGATSIAVDEADQTNMSGTYTVMFDNHATEYAGATVSITNSVGTITLPGGGLTTSIANNSSILIVPLNQGTANGAVTSGTRVVKVTPVTANSSIRIKRPPIAGQRLKHAASGTLYEIESAVLNGSDYDVTLKNNLGENIANGARIWITPNCVRGDVAVDAEITRALPLHVAYKKGWSFGVGNYLGDFDALVTELFSQCVHQIEGKYFLSSGADGSLASSTHGTNNMTYYNLEGLYYISINAASQTHRDIASGLIDTFFEKLPQHQLLSSVATRDGWGPVFSRDYDDDGPATAPDGSTINVKPLDIGFNNTHTSGNDNGLNPENTRMISNLVRYLVHSNDPRAYRALASMRQCERYIYTWGKAPYSADLADAERSGSLSEVDRVTLMAGFLTMAIFAPDQLVKYWEVLDFQWNAGGFYNEGSDPFFHIERLLGSHLVLWDAIKWQLNNWQASDAFNLPEGAAAANTRTLTWVYDDTGVGPFGGDIVLPFGCRIRGWSLAADASGSVTIDLWNDAFGNGVPTDADSITASLPIQMTSRQYATSSTLTGWTTTLNRSSIVRPNVDSITTVKRFTLQLFVEVIP